MAALSNVYDLKHDSKLFIIYVSIKQKLQPAAHIKLLDNQE